MTAGDAKFSDAMSCSVVFWRSTSRSIIENSASSRVVGQGMRVASISRGELVRIGAGLSEQSVDFRNAGLMTAAGEGGVHEGVEGFTRDFVADQPLAEADDV